MLCLQVRQKAKKILAALLIFPGLGIETLHSCKVLSYRQQTGLLSESSHFLCPYIYMPREYLPLQQTGLGFQPTHYLPSQNATGYKICPLPLMSW